MRPKAALSDIVIRRPFDSMVLKQDNVKQQILCQASQLVPESEQPSVASPTDDGYVYKTVALGLGYSAGGCWSGTVQSPLRQIVARTPFSVEIQGNYSTTYYLDTLACGHQVAVFPQAGQVNQKRHRCPECGKAQMALKFPAQSVRTSSKKEVA